MELSKIQRNIVQSNAEKIIILAAAGSGKTKIVTERVRHVLQSGADPTKVLAITFTRLAAEEMRQRLGHPKDVFVGTLHSYAFQLLTAHGIDCAPYIEAELFDESFEELRRHPEFIKPIDFLVLDEAQDSTNQQFQFILEVLRPKQWMLVGDPRQSIYQWRSAHPEHFLAISRRPDITLYEMNDNYRCGYNIVNFAKKIIFLLGADYVDESESKAPTLGHVQVMDYNFYVIPSLIRSKDDYRDWFVLTRTNEESDIIISMLKKSEIPCTTFKRRDLDLIDLQAIMMSNTVKVLTIHTAKGLECKNVIAVGMRRFKDPEEICVAYVAATRAKENLYWMPKRLAQKKTIKRWK